MSELTDKIRQVAESGIKDPSLFLVEVIVSSGRQTRVSVLLDGDNGVTIDECSSLSRHIGATIEEENIIENAYTLDVGSPGLDTPLMQERQFVKNVGRNLKLKMADGSTQKGVLEKVEGETIILLLKGKNEPTVIEMKEIEWAKVQVSFNSK